jgi:biotin operon repressor
LATILKIPVLDVIQYPIAKDIIYASIYYMIRDTKIDSLLELAKDINLSDNQIAAKLNVSVASVRLWKYQLRKVGIEVLSNKRHIPDIENKIKKLIEFAPCGYTNRQLAVLVGVKECSIWKLKRIIRDRGISIIPAIGRPKDQRVTDIGILNPDELVTEPANNIKIISL